MGRTERPHWPLPVRAAANALVPFVVIGLGRFAYATVVPPMRADLEWDYLDAAVPATTNAVGYLLGVLLAEPAAKRLGRRTATAGALAVSVVALAATPAFATVSWISGARFVIGVTGGIAFIGAGVNAAVLRDEGSRSAIPSYPAGAGLGVAVSAVAVPALVAGPSDWPAGWAAFAVLAASAAVAYAAVRPDHGAHDTRSPSPTHRGEYPGRATLTVSYGMFGAGYVVFATFCLASFTDRDASAASVRWFFVTVGVTSAVASVAWRNVLERLPGLLPAALPAALTGIAVALSLLPPQPATMIVVAVLFGGSWLAVVSGVTHVVRRELPPAAWTGALARLTLAFGTGQIVGPVVTVAAGGSTDHAEHAIGLSAAVLLASAVLAARRPRRPVNPPARRSAARSESVAIGPSTDPAGHPVRKTLRFQHEGES